MNENDIELEEIDITSLGEVSETLPPLPETAPEYNEDVEYNSSSNNRIQEYGVDTNGDVQSYDDNIDWGSLQPADESGFANPQQVDYESLTPYDAGAVPNSIWDELGVKKDLGGLTEYRGQLARQVSSGKLSLEEAQDMIRRRHSDILNKYGMTEVPEFSFAKFKQNPFRTCFGEAAQMLPFYWNGAKKGAVASVATVPGAIAKNAIIGVATGSVEPGLGNAIGGTAGVVKGLVEGVNSGMMIGTFLESMEVEGGNLYMDLREKGISHETAHTMSLAGGITNALLETASFGVLTAPIKGAAKKATAKLLWKQIQHNPAAKKGIESVIKTCVTEYCKRMGTEVTTEMLQDVTGNVMTLLAAQADSVEDAKPTAADWGAIIKETGPKTAAAMLVMGAIGTPFDVMNAEVGSIKSNGGEFEVATKEEIEANLKDVYEGKQVIVGNSFTLEGRVEYNTANMSELEAEYSESQAKVDEITSAITQLEKKKNLTPEDTAKLEEYKTNLKFEQDYQGLIAEEMGRGSDNQVKRETIKTRKQELTDKGKKQKLSPEELAELNDIWIEEEKAKGEKEINESVQKAREQELNKQVRDLDHEIEKVQKREDNARENRNKIEEQQDANNSKIAELEKENKEIQKALKNTDIEEDVTEMKTTLSKNREMISELKRNNAALEKRRVKLNSEIESAIAEGERLGNERSVLNEERSQLSEGLINENGKVDMTAGGYKNAQLSALKSRLKAMQQGIKRGVRLARREIRDVQNSAISMIKNSAMSDKDKSKSLTTIRDLNSQEKFSKALPKLIDKISELEEKHNKKQLTNYIGKLLKKAKPKKGGKTPQGKFNADIQKILDDITEAAKLTEAQAFKEIENIFDAAGSNMLTDEQTARVRTLYDFGGMDGKTSSELLRNARAIRMLIEDGKIAGQFKEQAKKEHKEKILAEAKESIIGDVEPSGDRKKNLANEIKQAFRRFNVISEGWEGLMNIASLHDKDRKLVKLLDVFPSKMARIKGEMESFNKFAKMAMEALNCKNTKQFNTKVKRDSIIRDIGDYTDKDGKRVTLQASKAEMRKLYMEMQDPSLREQLKNNNGYTFKEDMTDSISAKESDNKTLDVLFSKNNNLGFTILDKSTEELIEENLEPEDFALIDAEFKFYKEYHSRLNAFYREKFGIDMPFNEFYSPISREIDGGNKTDDWMNRESYQKSMIPGNFRNRINSDKKIMLKNDIAVMQEHIANSEHFMAMDQFVTDANTIFGNAEIRDIIRDKYGKNFLAILDKQLKDIANDGVQSTHPEMGMIAKMRNMFTGAALGGRAKILFTQLTAIGVFSDAIPAKDFAIGIADFMRHPREATRILSESYLLKDRANSINMEIKDIVRSQEFQAITRYKDFRNSLYFFTQLGDKWSIVAGGWAVYREALNRTGDKTKAMEAFERAVDTYQQSGHIDQLSSWQRGGPFQKALTMFMSDQMKQLRMEVRTVKDAIIFKDKEHIAKAAKTVAIMHFVLPTLVQFVANGFAWDDEDQLKAAILGPFTSIAVVGQILSAGVALAMKEYGAMTDNGNLKDMDMFESLDINIFGPVNRLKDEISKLIDKRYKDDISDEDLAEFWVKIFKNTIGPYSGLPLKFAFDVWDKSPEYYEDGRTMDLIKLWSGVSPYTIENKGKDEE